MIALYLLNPLSGSSSDFKSRNAELGNGQHAVVIRHGADHNHRLSFFIFRVGDNLRERDS